MNESGRSRHGRWRVPGLALILVCGATKPLTGQQLWDGHRGTLSAGYEVAWPTGWVRVRENAIAGTRLALGPDLGVHTARTVSLRVGLRSGTGEFGARIDATALRGVARLARDVTFNGSTLAGGTVVRTRIDGTDDLRIVLDYAHPLTRVGAHGDLQGRVGLDATLLEFRLQGTLSPATVGHETKEDFVTQELPTPFVGGNLRLPLRGHACLRLAADAGALPWVSSLRREGGLVRLRQRRLDASAGMDVMLARRLRLGLVLHYTDFAQNEQSREDGNEFRMASAGGDLKASWSF